MRLLRSLYVGETALEAFFRRRRLTSKDVELGWIIIERARAYNRGHERLGCVRVSAEDASEEALRDAIRRLEIGSYR